MSYLGAKSQDGVWRAIVALMPPHDTFLEPFVGSGVILRRKFPAAQSIVLDLDPRVAPRFAGLARVAVHVGDALAYLAKFDPRRHGRVLLYADPPYVLSTRTSRHRYRHDFTEADHRRLAAELHRLSVLGVAVILSGYPSPLYDELYPDWNTRAFQAMTRGGVRTEKLWFNFEPDAVHWSALAGRDFIDRQRIKRKAARWAARFEALAPAERQAVLAALLATGDRP